MPNNVTLSLYLGSGEAGMKLYERIVKAAAKERKSVSEFVKEAVIKELT